MTEGELLEQNSDKPRRNTDYSREWRRRMVWEMRSTGHSIDDIVTMLKQDRPDVRISHGTVFNDLRLKQAEIDESFDHFISNLPRENHLSMTHLELIKKHAWQLFAKSHNEGVKVDCLNTALKAEVELNKVRGDPFVIRKVWKRKEQSNK